LKAKAQRLVDAVAATGHSPALLSTLAEVEGQIANLGVKIENFAPLNVSATVAEIRDFIYSNVMNLRGLLLADASRSKIALARHIGQLILKPKQTPTGPVYEVSGGVDLLAQDVMPVVARDGIEPPPPAFSGPPTELAKWFEINVIDSGEKGYTQIGLGPFGMVWGVFAPSMFGYCSGEFPAGSRLRA
jgi:hypothetical protein